MVYRILQYIATFLALIVVLPVHEYAHAMVAVKNGDYTPKLEGRCTLNPIAHFDYAGLICFVLAGFGWAKPVPINPYNFRNQKLGRFTVAIAGVVANYCLAFLIYPLFVLSLRLQQVGYFTEVLQLTLYYIFYMCLSFFVFNLLPLYPLDGFMAIDAFVEKSNKVYDFLRFKGRYVLFALCFLSILADITNIAYLDVLGIAIRFVVSYIEIPIISFWGLIF